MSEISNTIYVFKKVMKQMMALKKHEVIAKKNKEKIRKGVNVNEFINININDIQENQENKKVKTSRDTPWVCECGAELLLGGKNLHITRKKHFTNMKLKEGLPVCVIIQEAVLIPKIQNIIEVIPEIVVPEPEIVVPEPEIIPEVVIPKLKRVKKVKKVIEIIPEVVIPHRQPMNETTRSFINAIILNDNVKKVKKVFRKVVKPIEE